MTFEEAHRRIKRGDLEALRAALDLGLDPNLTNRFRWSLLMLCAMEGFLDAGKLVHAAGARIESENNVGETALSLAAHAGHLRFVEWLVAKGAPKNPSPHGHDLATWVENTSGLPQSKIAAILDALR